MRARMPRSFEASRTTLLAPDGARVPLHVYEPGGAARATVLLCGGTGIPQSFYAPFADHLARRGMRVVTFDYRGVGEARPASLRAMRADLVDWARLDAVAVHGHARALARGGPLLLVGHSFGGQLLGVASELHDVDAALLVGVSLGWVGHFAPWTRARYALLSRLAPLLTSALGYAPGRVGFGTDLPAGVARQWARWSLLPRHLIDEVDDARDRFARWDRPTLFYSFTDDDDYAPEGAVRAYLDAVAGAPLTHRRLGPADAGGPIGHFGFFRPRFEATLWAEATGWLDDVAAGRPPRLGGRDAGALFDLTLDEITRDLTYPGG